MLRVAEDLWPHLESGERAQGAWDPCGVGAGGGWEAGGPGSHGLWSQAARAWVLALGLLSRVALVKVWAVGSLVCWVPHAGLWHPSKSTTVCGAGPLSPVPSWGGGGGGHFLRLPVPPESRLPL